MKNDDVVALWQTQSSDGFRMRTEEIRKRIETMNRKMRRRTIDGYLVCATLIIFFAIWLFIGTNKLQTIGAVLTIIGVSYLAWQIRANRSRSLPIDGGTLQHLRNELVRQRDFHHLGSGFWWRMLLFIPGPLVFSAGFAQAHPEEPTSTFIRIETISFVVLALATIPLNAWMARRYQKQIDALTRLQEEP